MAKAQGKAKGGKPAASTTTTRKTASKATASRKSGKPAAKKPAARKPAARAPAANDVQSSELSRIGFDGRCVMLMPGKPFEQLENGSIGSHRERCGCFAVVVPRAGQGTVF